MHVRREAVGLLLGLAVLGAGCRGLNPRAVEVAKLTGVPAAGEPLYRAECERCHGADGKGTDLALHDGHRVNLVTARTVYGTADFVTVILEGTEGTTMPAYPGYTDQQLADLDAYIRALPK